MLGLYVSYKLRTNFCSSSCDGRYAHACSPHVEFKLGCDINLFGRYVQLSRYTVISLKSVFGNLMEILKNSRVVRRTGRSEGTVTSMHPETVRVNVHVKCYSSSSVLFGCIRKIGKNRPLISLCLSVCLSVRMKHIGCHRKNFHEIWYMNIIRTSGRKFGFIEM
jgi:hypothetical protein